MDSAGCLEDSSLQVRREREREGGREGGRERAACTQLNVHISTCSPPGSGHSIPSCH